MDLVEYFVSQGANDWNQGMCRAAQAGHMDLVRYFVSKGANNWNAGILWTKTGEQTLIDFFQDKIELELK